MTFYNKYSKQKALPLDSPDFVDATLECCSDNHGVIRLHEIHIVLKQLVNLNVDLENDQKVLDQGFMKKLIRLYYESMFEEINDSGEDKNLLLFCLKTTGDATERAYISDDIADKERLSRLEQNGIIRKFSNGYEFLHDQLAIYFYHNILKDEDRKKLKIMNIVQSSETIDIDTLNYINSHREDILEFLKRKYALNTNNKIDVLVKSCLNNAISKELTNYWMDKAPDIKHLIPTLMSYLSDHWSDRSLGQIVSFLENDNEKQTKLKEYINEKMEQRNGDWRLNSIHDIIDQKTSGKQLSFKKEFKKTNSGKPERIYMSSRFIEVEKEMLAFLDFYGLNANDNFQYMDIQKFFLSKIPELFCYGTQNGATSDSYLVYTTISEGRKVKSETEKSLIEIIKLLCESQQKYFGNGSAYLQTISGYVVYEKTSKDDVSFFLVNNQRKEDRHLLELNDIEDKKRFIRFAYQNSTKKIIFNLFGNFINGSFTPICGLTYQTSNNNSSVFFLDDVETMIWKSRVPTFKKQGTVFESVGIENVNSYLKARTINLDDKDRFRYIVYYSNNEKLQTLLLYLEEINSLIIDNRLKGVDSINVLLEEKFKFNGISCFSNFIIRLNNKHVIDPFIVEGSVTCNLSEEIVVYGNSLKTEGSAVLDVSTNCPGTIVCNNNASPIVIVVIGSQTTYPFLDKYKDSASFFIYWEDRITKVSNVINAWSYEIEKLVRVIKSNDFIKHILIVGNKKDSERSIDYLQQGITLNAATLKNTGIKYRELFDLYGDDYVNNLKSVFANTDNKLFEVSEYRKIIDIDKSLQEYIKTKLLESPLHFVKNIHASNDIKEKIAQNEANKFLKYLNKQDSNLLISKNYIKAKSLEIAHKAVILNIVQNGRVVTDTYGNEVSEILGVCVEVTGIKRGNIQMDFRKYEIDLAYNQWIKSKDNKYNNNIYRDMVDKFDQDQIEKARNKLMSNIEQGVNTRDISFSYHHPSKDKKVPSINSAFIFSKVDKGKRECIVDTYFTWRSNECVFGLPLSLRNSIKFVDEQILDPVEAMIKSKKGFEKYVIKHGSYFYNGVNMHFYKNDLMADIIIKILSEKRKTT